MSDPGDEVTTVIQSEADTGRRRLDFDKHRDWVLIGLVLAILALLVWREWRLADESEQKQEARSTAVGLAAQVQAECDDPEVGVDLAICQQAEEIVEDPQNPPAPPMPEEGEPGEPGKPGPAASPAQVRAAVAELIQAAVDQWLEDNPLPPGTASEGPTGPTGAVGARGPAGEAGSDGRGIASTSVRDCILIVTYTDGTSQSAGRVCPGRSDKP